ncbi:hypothetical protein, unlikely [Trypanosoma brucei gambiense DAL972]|uniref:Uncharacterized protein n=1 Tax=Trypanosoma brucei gambiense (strain MHOM/CI/86/DAL972) TaxID=679716 RepID=C9ZV96_TRYB9|nr:hypothetical protein, unlikely [Trypanosoma brucei gambiense DAL972]CBH13334.1 hypothetical protein, unlikely [Trypanosoma brucei gambiense DAL972]|eukprot:XP_011775611.1 hypothetical protein, unlikely [Trypanosoma brucei gambiense DAL972]
MQNPLYQSCLVPHSVPPETSPPTFLLLIFSRLFCLLSSHVQLNCGAEVSNTLSGGYGYTSRVFMCSFLTKGFFLRKKRCSKNQPLRYLLPLSLQCTCKRANK